MATTHSILDIIRIFNDSFADSFNTRLVRGEAEPIYLPAGSSDLGISPQPYHQVVFAHGYYASALHEIAHWCLAGEARRQQVDFGYWYCPDGRNAQQQMAFQKAEMKPQAIEWALSKAAGFEFNVSCDNLSGDEFGRQPDRIAFQQDILEQVQNYLDVGFPKRAVTLMANLAKFYDQTVPTAIETFIQDMPVKRCA